MAKGEGTIKYQGVEIDIEYYYEPLVRGRMYMDNGDPGYSDEGGDFYIDRAFIGGQDVTELLGDEILESISDAYYEQCDGEF
jgi:hypothetical protein